MEQDTVDPKVSDWPEIAPPTVTPETGQAARRTTVLKGVGIVVTGLVAGAIGVATIHSSSASPTANANRPAFGGPGGGRGFAGQGQGQGQGFGGGPRGGFPGQGGGQPGAQTQQTASLSGTVSSVGTSGLTVDVGGAATSVTTGTATVITRNGAVVPLSGLKPGDTVTVSVSGGTASRVTATGSGAST